MKVYEYQADVSRCPPSISPCDDEGSPSWKGYFATTSERKRERKKGNRLALNAVTRRGFLPPISESNQAP
jgi:hypothetical protein